MVTRYGSKLEASDVIKVDEGFSQLGEFSLGGSFRLQFHLVDFQAAYWSIFLNQYVYWKLPEWSQSISIDW